MTFLDSEAQGLEAGYELHSEALPANVFGVSTGNHGHQGDFGGTLDPNGVVAVGSRPESARYRPSWNPSLAGLVRQ